MLKDREVDLAYTYEQYLLGNNKISKHVYFEAGKDKSEEIALIMLRYSVENLLKWTPRQMAENFGPEVIKKMKLQNIIDKIEIPSELDPKKDYFYYAHLLYPDKIPYNEKRAILNAFQNLFRLDENGEPIAKKLKKGFLEGVAGEYRLKICLQYILENEGFSTIKEMYETFSKPAGNKLLRKYKLEVPARFHFASALDFLHESLPESQKSNFYYTYFKYRNKVKKK